MEQLVTFNKILKYIEQYQQSSPRMKSFGYGDIVYFATTNSGTTEYPLVFVTPINITYDENISTYNLSVIFGDIVNTDMSNEASVVSDMSLEAKRFIAEIKRGFLEDKMDVELPVLSQPFFERFNDHIGGVALDINIIVNEYLDACLQYQPEISPTPTPSITPTNTPTSTPSVTPTPTPSPLALTTEYQAILSRASSLGYGEPSYSEKQKQNQLIVDLKNAGLWSKLGNFYMFKLNTTGGVSPAFTLIDWIDPTSALSRLEILAGSIIIPEFRNDEGWYIDNNHNYVVVGSNVIVGTNPITSTSTGNTEGMYLNSVSGGTAPVPYLWSSNNNQWNAARYANVTTQNIFRSNGLTTSYDFTGLGFKSASIDGLITTDTTVIFNNAGTQTTRTKTGVDTTPAGNVGFNMGYPFGQDFKFNVGLWFSGGGGLTSSDAVTLEGIITPYMNS